MGKDITLITIGRSGSIPKAAPRPLAQDTGRTGVPAARLPMRRRFTAAYKLRMLQQAERAVKEGGGALGALLAREGLYSSHLAQWRRRFREGSLKVSRGRPAIGRQALHRENARLRRKLAYLEACLREAILAVKPPQGRGAAAHTDWIMRQRLLHLADLALAARDDRPQAAREGAPQAPRGPSAGPAR